jgi:hypothetical protein
VSWADTTAVNNSAAVKSFINVLLIEVWDHYCNAVAGGQCRGLFARQCGPGPPGAEHALPRR